MRTKFLLTLALVMLPLSLASMVGCDSGQTVVGTGTKEPPPDVKARLEAEKKNYDDMMKKNNEAGTPIPEGQTPPTGN